MKENGERKKYGILIFGFGSWGDYSPPLSVGNGGMSNRHVAWIDMRNVDANGNYRTVNYSHLDASGVSRRVWNLGRILEHEWLGHAVHRMRDIPGWQGPTVRYVNKFQAEMGLPQRLNYDTGYFGIFFSHDNSRSSYRNLVRQAKHGETVPRVLLNKKP
jgi:hypothetical protein